MNNIQNMLNSNFYNKSQIHRGMSSEQRAYRRFSHRSAIAAVEVEHRRSG